MLCETRCVLQKAFKIGIGAVKCSAAGLVRCESACIAECAPRPILCQGALRTLKTGHGASRVKVSPQAANLAEVWK
jgi:hypothetical protein